MPVVVKTPGKDHRFNADTTVKSALDSLKYSLVCEGGHIEDAQGQHVLLDVPIGSADHHPLYYVGFRDVSGTSWIQANIHFTSTNWFLDILTFYLTYHPLALHITRTSSFTNLLQS